MDFNLMKNNKVFVSGEVVSEPKFSHEVYGENFFEFDLRVSRLSQSYSQPVLALREAGQAEDYEVGDDEGADGDRRDGGGYWQHAVPKVVEEVKHHNVSQVHRETAH